MSIDLQFTRTRLIPKRLARTCAGDRCSLQGEKKRLGTGLAIPAAIMFLGVLLLPESPRWLFLKGFKDRAVAVFEGMHLEDAEIAAEVKAIEANLKIKQNGFEMFKTNPNFRRAIGLGIGLQVIQQLAGINVVTFGLFSLNFSRKGGTRSCAIRRCKPGRCFPRTIVGCRGFALDTEIVTHSGKKKHSFRQ